MVRICHVVLLPVILLLSAPTPTSFSPPCQECHHPPLRAVLQGRKYHNTAKHLTKKHLHANKWDHLVCIKVLVDRPTPTRSAHFGYACMCFLHWVKSTDSRSLQEKEGTRRGVYIFFRCYQNAPSTAVCRLGCKAFTLLLNQIKHT